MHGSVASCIRPPSTPPPSGPLSALPGPTCLPCNSTVLGENAALTLASPTCVSKAGWGGFQCTGVTFRAVSVRPRVQNVFRKKALGPVRVTRFDSGVVLNGDDSDIFYARTYGSVGAFPDMCPDVMPNGRYRFLTAVGFEHEVFFTNSLPSLMELRYFSFSDAESILMRLFVVDPNALDVFTGTAKVNASTNARPTLTDPAGTNQLDPQSTLCRAGAGVNVGLGV